MPVNIIDAVPELSRKHFEEALRTARTSVTRTVIFYIFLRTWRNLSSLEGNSTLHMLPDKLAQGELKLTGLHSQVRMCFRINLTMPWNKMMIYTVEYCLKLIIIL